MSGAIASSDRDTKAMHFGSTEIRNNLLRDLDTHGLVAGRTSPHGRDVSTHNFDYTLRSEAMDRLDCGCAVMYPKAVLAQPSVPVHRWHGMHLVLALVDEGWEWQKRTCRQMLQAPPYQVGGRRLWFSTGTAACSIDSAYVRALLDSDRLHALGIQSIPHGHPSAVYEGLLLGQVPKMAALTAPGLSKHKVLAALEMDGIVTPGGQQVEKEFETH